LELNIKYT